MPSMVADHFADALAAAGIKPEWDRAIIGGGVDEILDLATANLPR